MEQSNTSLKKILEHLPISIVIANIDTGTIIWVNSRELQLAGATSPDQLIGRNLLEFLNPDEHETALRDLARVAAGESPPPVIYRLRQLTGGSADVQISSIPVRFEGQKAVLSVCADVTEQQRVCRALAESEERYRTLIECAPSGVVVILDTEETVYANQALMRMLGAEPTDRLPSMPMRRYIHPEDLKAVREGRKHVLDTRETIPPTHTRLVRADGTEIVVSAQTAFVKWQGEDATQTILREEPLPT